MLWRQHGLAGLRAGLRRRRPLDGSFGTWLWARGLASGPGEGTGSHWMDRVVSVGGGSDGDEGPLTSGLGGIRLGTTPMAGLAHGAVLGEDGGTVVLSTVVSERAGATGDGGGSHRAEGCGALGRAYK